MMNIRNILTALALGTCVPLASAQAQMLSGTPRTPATIGLASPDQVESAKTAAQIKRVEFEQILKRRFVVHGNEVYDKKTDLTWQRCNYGETWDEEEHWCKGVTKRLSMTQVLADVEKDQNGWRLPDIGEVMSLLEVACADTKTADNPVPVFPEMLPNTYYLSSSMRDDQNNVNVGQCFGSMVNNVGVGKGYVSVARLVRSGHAFK
ncbi:DUF1566 domain-containing protein [Paraburkholderia sp. J67]|uniref:Lcl C-terminal domain-containing protein n=1 Tax=Paraburkholderia sp. J67 TaxID=2805435 RepID=UPI002ABD272E|nr:DUF1566 domain-containing protein [Paraburkholderia sp. J67]